MSLFSRLSENRFPKDRGFTNVGPGSYEVPTCLDEKGVLIREGRDRFEENSEASFSIFIDEADADRPARTPRGLRPSTKENIVGSASRARSKSLGSRSEPGDEKAKTVDTSITRKNSTLTGSHSSAKLQAKDRSIAELQKRVEELEMEGRDAHNTITGLRAKAEENERALKAQGSKQPLDGSQAPAPALDREALQALVEELVYHHLETPRQVLCLQRQAWRQQADKMQQDHEQEVVKWLETQRKLKEDAAGAEMRAKNAELKSAAAEEKVTVAEELARQRESEVTRLSAELPRLSAELEAARTHAGATAEEAESLRQLVSALQKAAESRESEDRKALQEAESLRLLESQKAAEMAKALEVSQLEQERLQEMLAVTQDAMNRYKEREANMAGHLNHKQKIRITLDLKKENAALQEEVNRLRQKVLHLERQLVAPKSSTSGHKSSVRKQLLSQPEGTEAEGEAARASVEASVADLAAVAEEVAKDFQTAARTIK